MRVKFCVLIATLALFVAGCSSTPYVPPPDITTIQQSKPIGAATVYIYRTHIKFDAGVGVLLSVNGKPVVNLKDASYTVTYWKPGHYQIAGKSDNVMSTWNIPSGEVDIPTAGTYYLAFDRTVESVTSNQMTMMMINGMPMPIFTPVDTITKREEHWSLMDEATAQAEMAKLGYIEPTAKEVP